MQCKIPAIGIASSNIVHYAIGYNFKYNNGMPIRYVAVPFPFTGQPRAVDVGYVTGKDMLSGAPLMNAVVKALTDPLTAEEKISGPPPGGESESRLLPPDTEDNLRLLFDNKGWTDYNSIILPTEKSVMAMLAGTSRKPDEVVTTVNITGGSRLVTVEKVAISAVMAGASPEHFPVILALATQAPFGNSTSSMANMVVISGPIRNKLKFNCGTNALGPYNRSNAVVGRAFTMISKTAGDLRSDINAWESLGSNFQYNNICFGENEENLPEGWSPLHVQMGFKPGDNILTVATGWTSISSVGGSQSLYPTHYLMRDYMSSLSASGSSATVMMDPTVATLLQETHGFKTKEQLSEWFSQNVQKTAASYWGNGVIQSTAVPLALQGLEPYASWRKLPDETPIKPFTNSRAIHVVVVGGKVQTVWFVTDFGMRRGIKIDDWA
ncbi:MAG TPA: hypothetical protein VHX36_08785 [Candidatus Acidoferrales bacterium]|nr:hypothetical protein [Candidatus Acidoferrales bacterium]